MTRLMAQEPASPDTHLESAVCAGCGCLCDDVSVVFRGAAITGVENACALGESWLRALGPLEPAAFIGGKPVSLDDAAREAAALLDRCIAPVVIGLHGLGLEALRETAALAEACGAPLAAWPPFPRAVLESGAHAPECTATLGEVRATADLVVFWRASPETTHPRHLERYSFEPPLLSGRKRAVFVHSGLCDLAPDLEAVRGLRLVLEKDGAAPREERVRGLVEQLAMRIRGARHTHLFLGATAIESPAIWDELNLLAARVRERFRITVSALPAAGNSRGVLEVLAWRTGSAGADVAADRILETGAVDLVLAFALDPGSLPDAALASYAAAQRIVVGPGADAAAAVSIRIPPLDPRLAATVVRSDGIHLTLSGRRARGSRDPGAAVVTAIRRAALDRSRKPS